MIRQLDHLVLTTADRAACTDFYTRVLGMRVEVFGNDRIAFKFGNQKINLHEKGREFEPKANVPTHGALDLCLIVDRPLADVIEHLVNCHLPIVEGPLQKPNQGRQCDQSRAAMGARQRASPVRHAEARKRELSTPTIRDPARIPGSRQLGAAFSPSAMSESTNSRAKAGSAASL